MRSIPQLATGSVTTPPLVASKVAVILSVGRISSTTVSSRTWATSGRLAKAMAAVRLPLAAILLIIQSGRMVVTSPLTCRWSNVESAFAWLATAVSCRLSKSAVRCAAWVGALSWLKSADLRDRQ